MFDSDHRHRVLIGKDPPVRIIIESRADRRLYVCWNGCAADRTDSDAGSRSDAAARSMRVPTSVS